MSDLKNRLFVEMNDLQLKLSKLEGFISGETFTMDLSVHQQALLTVQAQFMRGYLGVLRMRVTDLTNEERKPEEGPDVL